MKTICVDCGREIIPPPPARLDDGVQPVSHGLCVYCAATSGAFPVEDLSHLSEEERRTLPLGLIELGPNGRILDYNAAEEDLSHRNREEVIGRNFFRDVAPCTGVEDYEGLYRALVRGEVLGPQTFAYLYTFDERWVLTHVQMRFDPTTGRGHLLTRHLGESRLPTPPSS